MKFNEKNYHLLPAYNHIIKTHDDVNTICQSLFATSPIQFFWFVRQYYDGSAAVLFSNPETHFFMDSNKDLYISPTEIEQSNKYGIISALDYTSHPFKKGRQIELLKNLRERFNLDYMMITCERGNNFFDAYVFSTFASHMNTIDYYLNNPNVIEKFKIYFMEKASVLIKNASLRKNRTLIPGFENFHLKEKNYFTADKETNIANYIPSHLITRLYYLEYFTKREIECLKFILFGKTFKEIAKEMHISPRTVETHINHIYIKTGSSNRSQLIKYLINKLR